MDDCGWECVWGLMDKGCGRGGIWMWADVQSMWKRMGCGLGLMYKVCGREWAIGRDYCIRDVEDGGIWIGTDIQGMWKRVAC